MYVNSYHFKSHSKLNERIKSAKDQNSDQFFDVCNEKISELSIKDKKNKKSKVTRGYTVEADILT